MPQVRTRVKYGTVTVYLLEREYRHSTSQNDVRKGCNEQISVVLGPLSADIPTLLHTLAFIC